MGISEKGSSRERELVDMFWDAGFGVVRAPASGSATKKALPDIIAGDGDKYIAVEAKSSGGDVFYIEGREVEELIVFAERFGAKARVGIRFDREDWRFMHPSDLYNTDGGNYRVKKEFIMKAGESFDALIG